MKTLRKLAATGAVLAVLPTAAMAQTSGGSTLPDLTPISDAVVEGVTQGITVLMAVAPILIGFSIVWGLINKARRMAK